MSDAFSTPLRTLRINANCRALGIAPDAVSIEDAWKLRDDMASHLEVTPPHDPAFTYLFERKQAWGRLAFLLECEKRGITHPILEAKLRDLVDAIGRNVFGLTPDQAMAKAIEFDEKSRAPVDQLPGTVLPVTSRNRLRETSEAYLKLSQILST